MGSGSVSTIDSALILGEQNKEKYALFYYTFNTHPRSPPTKKHHLYNSNVDINNKENMGKKAISKMQFVFIIRNHRFDKYLCVYKLL